MDWSKIEKNVHFHTTQRLQQQEKPSSRYFSNSGSSRSASGGGIGRGGGGGGGALISYGPEEDSFSSSYNGGNRSFYSHGGQSRGGEEEKFSAPDDDEFEPPISGSGLANEAIICSDIDEIKAQLRKQNSKIQNLELAMDQRDVALSVASKQDLMQDRIDRVEVDLKSCSKYLQNISQEASELGVQAKASNGRLAWVEDMYRSSSQEYVTKTTFSQLLTSCMDQLKDINTIAENARTQGTQSMHFVESFLAAISNLQSSQPSYSLEVLIGLSGERQKEQIAHAITDALQHAISREIDQGSARMRSVIEAVNEDIKRELVTTLQEIREQIAEHGKELGEEVFRNTEISMKSIQDLSKQADRQKRLVEGELSAAREAQQVIEIEQSEGRMAVQRLEDAVNKVQAMTVPALQRNHKSLVDEVIRIDSEQAASASHMENLDKQIAKLSAQLKHATKTLAALEHSEMKNREAANKQKEQEKENKENTMHEGKGFVPDTCKACERCGTRLEALEETAQRLAEAVGVVESNMDILQAELGSMSRTGEQQTLQIDKVKADLVIHKAGVVDMKNTLHDLKTHGCPLAKECKLKIHNITSTSASGTKLKNTEINSKSDTKTASPSSKPHQVELSLPGPTNALVEAIARTKTLTTGTTAATASTSNSANKCKSATPPNSPPHTTTSVSSSQHKKMNKIPPKAIKEIISPSPSSTKHHANSKSESNSSKETKIQTKTDSSNSKSPSAKGMSQNVSIKTVFSTTADKHDDGNEKSDADDDDSNDDDNDDNDNKRDGDDDDDDDDNDDDGGDDDDDDGDGLSVASASPLHSPEKKMTASSKLADSLDESLNSLSDHIANHIVPVKISHTPDERSQIIKGLSTSGPEQTEEMMNKYDQAVKEAHKNNVKNKEDDGDDKDETPEEDDSSESSFEESEDFHEDMATLLSPKGNNVTFSIVSDAEVKTKVKEDEEIGSRFNNLEHPPKKSNNQEDEEDDIGSRFDKLGNYIAPRRTEPPAQQNGAETQVQSQVQAPVLSGSLLGRKGAASSVSGSSSSLVTSTSIKNLKSASAATRLSSQSSAPRTNNTAQCTFCLRRMPVEDVRNHMKSCELRTELCKYGCRSKVLVIKMDKHLDICPKNPENMNK